MGIAFKEETVALFRETQCLLGPFELGDVSRHGINQMLFGKGSSGPREPAVRAILAPIPILKRDRIQTLCQLLTFLNGCLAVGGMDELKKRFRHQLSRGVSEHFLPGRIEALEISIIAGDTQQFDRKSEISIQFLASLVQLGDIPEEEQDPQPFTRGREDRRRAILNLKFLSVFRDQQRVVRKTDYLPLSKHFLN